MVNKDKMAEAARPLLERVGLEVDPNENVGKLSIGQQQMVEIAKSFSLNAKILILDEPTSSLSEKEVDILFKTVGDLKKQGMGIVFITHKMAEVFQLCDAVTIMRDGEFMGELQSKKCTEAQLISLMVGRDLGNYYVRTFNELGQVVLEARNICAGKRAINCSFSVRKGEILGFYGLVGAGRSELMKAVMGLDPLDSGEIYLKGELVKRPDPMFMQKRGVALVPESRKTEGLLLKNTIAFNISLPVLDRFMRGMRVDADKEAGIVEQGIDAKRGVIQATGWTSIQNMPGIFAGGDCATGPATVIRAIAAGKVAAANIDQYLGYNHEITCDVEIPAPDLSDRVPCGRVNLKERDAIERKSDFTITECGMSLKEAQQESRRCLRCDHFGYGNFKGGRIKSW